jgi:hypothetical protein
MHDGTKSVCESPLLAQQPATTLMKHFMFANIVDRIPLSSFCLLEDNLSFRVSFLRANEPGVPPSSCPVHSALGSNVGASIR